MLSAITAFLLFFSLGYLTVSYLVEADGQPRNYSRLLITSAVGPESLAFDCNGAGPYTGVSDGRILKWEGGDLGWTEFAVTSQHRRDVCDGSIDFRMEHVCGRPLGLQFNKATCDLYIADAYFGLVMVGRNGGRATQLANSAEGVPFRFTNGLDIDQENGVVYFTDSSIWFQRWEYMLEVLSGDKTGRLMKYDPRTKELTVLLRGLVYANGVAVSKASTYVLVAETTTCRIIRFWLQGPRAQTAEVFVQLPGNPDNIKRNARGEFWVALNPGRRGLGKSAAPFPTIAWRSWLKDEVVAVRVDEEGKIVEALYNTDGRSLKSISEVGENGQSLWIGSVDMPYVSII